MPSFRITISPSRRAAARFVSYVRRELLRALEQEKSNGVTQSKIARDLDVHRSVINREFRGQKDISVGRIGELAWAMGRRPSFGLPRAEAPEGANVSYELPIRSEARAANSAEVTYSDAAGNALQLATSARIEIYEAA